LAKRARLVMSHESGKVEVMGLTDEYVIFKYMRAADNEDNSKICLFKRNPRAYWLDDYEEAIDEFQLEYPSGYSEGNPHTNGNGTNGNGSNGYHLTQPESGPAN